MRDHNSNDSSTGADEGDFLKANGVEPEKVAGLMREAMRSYAQRGEQSPEDWLAAYLSAHAGSWPDAEATRPDAAALVAGVQAHRHIAADLAQHQAQGLSKGGWLARQVGLGAKAHGVAQLSAHAQQFEQALGLANELSSKAILCMDGSVSQCRNLDGFIAEHHHANTFNLDAAAKGSGLRARVLEPAPGSRYGRNSMDIGVYDANGKLAGRYQIKYGADAETSSQLFERGDYRGQRKLVPEGQAVEGSTDRIEIGGVRSKPLSKEDAKAAQEAAQQQGKARQYDWKDMDKAVFARQMGKQVVLGAAVSAAFHGSRLLGRRVWNWMNGRASPAVSEDLKEFFGDTAQSTAQAGTQVAVSGAMLVASRSGWLGSALKATPPGRIAVAAMVALENAKVLFKLGKGEIGSREALDRMGSVTATTLASVAAAGDGAAMGAAAGALLGPVGAAAGAVIGGIAGGMAGGYVGEKLYQGAKQVASAAVRTIERVASGVRDFASSTWSAVSSVFGAIF
jgi:hypothetical protein